MKTELHGIELPAMLEFDNGSGGWEEREVLHTDGGRAWHVNPPNNCLLRFPIDNYRPIPEKKTRLMTPEELWGKAVKVDDSWFSVCEIGEYCINFHGLEIGPSGGCPTIEEMHLSDSYIGWADSPTSEFHEGFEVEVTE
jgi:hypothetical protein